MKLQKLVYYAYGWWLPTHNQPIISEPPQVWVYGPVFGSLYHALKHFGRQPIFDTQSELPFTEPPLIEGDDKEAAQLRDWVWHKYGSFSSFHLSEMTHSHGSPWRIVAEKHDWKVPYSTPIPDEFIRSYFKREASGLGLQ